MIDPSLLDSSAVGQSLRSLATRVDRGGDPDAAQRLRLLGDAIGKKGSSAPTWVTADISKIIDPDSVAEHYRQRHATIPGCLLEVVEAVRNILIFVPIVVTWLGISQASASYNDYIGAALAKQDTARLSEPFLYLWQQGFDHRLNGWFTLSSIALVDVIVLVAIILLTILAHTISNASRLREENTVRELHSDLVHAIARATLCLHGGQQQFQATGGSNQTLDQVSVDIQNMAKKIMHTFGTLENDFMQRLDIVVNNLSREFDQIASDLKTQLQQGQNYLGTLGSTATSLQQLAQDIQSAAQYLTKANQDMTKSVNDLLGPAKDLAQQQQNLLQSVDKSVNLLQTNADALNDLVKEQTSLSSNLIASLGTVSTAAQKVADLEIQFDNLVKQQENLVQEMKGEHAAQAQLADNMLKAVLSTQDMHVELRKLAINFRQIATDTNDVMRLYAGLPKLVGTDMATAIQLIHKGGGDLSAAAMTIYSASQFFEKVVADQEQLLNNFEKVVVGQEQLVNRLAASGKI